jgi:hypothetical protein
MAVDFWLSSLTSQVCSLVFYPASPTAPRVVAAGGIIWLLSESVIQTYRVRAAMAHSFISSCIVKTRIISCLIAHDVWIRASRSVIGKVGLAQSEDGHFRPCVERALPTVRPRSSNSSADMLSRSIIESLTRSFLAVAVFTTPFGFFLASRL